MQNTRLIRGRIKSAKNIAQITKAMELVAATKMRKAQAAASAGKLYAQKVYEMVIRLGSTVGGQDHPFLLKRDALSGKKIIILVSTNKGLCGALNSNLFRYVLGKYGNDKGCEYITIGRKGAQFVSGLGETLKADFSETIPFTTTIPAVIDLVTQTYLKGDIDSVIVVFSEFISALKQQPVGKTLLPLTILALPGSKSITQDVKIEPNPEQVFASLLPHYIENQLRDAILQAEASEHSARMVAMQNATDNAKSLITELTLLYNKARQEKITYEISDMVTARMGVL